MWIHHRSLWSETLLPIAEALHDGMYAGTSQDYAQHIAELVSEDISQIEQAWTAYKKESVSIAEAEK